MMGDTHFSNNTPDSDISRGLQLGKPEPEGNISADCTQTHTHSERKWEREWCQDWQEFRIDSTAEKKTDPYCGL
jgi:hypothetical protein